MSIWQVILLGLIEGLTEFIPVSSTGHSCSPAISWASTRPARRSRC